MSPLVTSVTPSMRRTPREPHTLSLKLVDLRGPLTRGQDGGVPDPSLILGRRVVVVGYGNQGRAHALNLRDRGVAVTVGAREGRGAERAREDGFDPKPIRQAVDGAQVVALLLPDESLGKVFAAEVAPSLAPGASLVFAHGFSVVYGLLEPPEGVGCVLVSPVGPGTALREEFVAGRGIPAMLAAQPEGLLPLAGSYAWGLGCDRARLVETTFREETECDLFGEQAVLCGGMPALAEAAFETLVEAGFSPEVAYLECVHQVRLLAELVASVGVAGMRKRISDTAEWGSYQVGPEVVGEASREAMRRALERIRSGEFARGWVAEAEAGKPRLLAFREADRSSRIEATRRRLFPTTPE